MNFNGTPRPGGYCLRLQSAGCAQPYATPITRASLSNDESRAYCGIAESFATCEAVIDMTSSTNCAINEDCGGDGLADGRCETVGTLVNKCTYACESAAQCLGSQMCSVDTPYCH